MGLKGKRKLVWENGRQYLVSPATLLVSGVLAGSKGPLYYPPEEITASAAAWERMPLTLRHPVKNGVGISANTPGLLDVIGLGEVRDIRVLDNKRLRGQTWFDVERVRNTDPHLLERLERGENVELSTGLYTDNIEAPPGSSHNGRPYTHVARNYRPDHLAILPDEVGACSLADGCGVLTNRGEMVFNSLTFLQEPKWVAVGNCGGKGGTPGPCKGWKKSLGQEGQKAKSGAQKSEPKKKAEGKKKTETKKGKKSSAEEKTPASSEEKPAEAKDTIKSVAGKDKGEIVRQLLTETSTKSSSNPRNYDLNNFPPGVDGEKLLTDVERILSREKKVNSFARPNIRSVYDKVKGDHPDLTLSKFQGALAKMQKDGSVELRAYTQALTTAPDPEAIMPLDFDPKYYLDFGKKRLARNESMLWLELNCGGPGSGVPGPCPGEKASFKELEKVSGARGNRETRKAQVNSLRSQLKKDPAALAGLGDQKKTYSTLEKITGTVFTTLLDAQETVGKMIENEINPGKLPDDVTEAVATVGSLNIEDLSSPSASYLAAATMMHVAPKVLAEIQDSTRWLMDKLSGRKRVVNKWQELAAGGRGGREGEHARSQGQGGGEACGCGNPGVPCRCQKATVWRPVGNRTESARRCRGGNRTGAGGAGPELTWREVTPKLWGLLANAELSGGRWVTTEDGNHLYIKDDGEIVGNPHVVKAAKEKGQSEAQKTDGKPEIKLGDGRELKPPVVSKNEQAAFKHYSGVGQGYKNINAGLRNGTNLTGKDAKAAKLISQVMEREPDFDEPVAVYRSMSWKDSSEYEQFVENLQEGGTIQTKGFLSTSLSQRYAEETFGHQKGGSVSMEIVAKRGIRMSGKLTEFEEEQEVLMNHNSQFKVLSVRREGGKTHVRLEQVK